MALLVACFIACAFVAAPAATQQIVLSSGNVVGASSVFFQGAGNVGNVFVQNGARVTGSFGAGNIFNSQTSDPTQEILFSGEYFLSGDGVQSATVVNPYITIDLGSVYSVGSFVLYDTTNGFTNDRGTGSFQILGANALVVDGDNGFTLAGSTINLATGTLAPQSYPNLPVAQNFTSLSGTGVRYLQFSAAKRFGNKPYQRHGLRAQRTQGLCRFPCVRRDSGAGKLGDDAAGLRDDWHGHAAAGQVCRGLISVRCNLCDWRSRQIVAIRS
jgi:hypothetical protein